MTPMTMSVLETMTAATMSAKAVSNQYPAYTQSAPSPRGLSIGAGSIPQSMNPRNPVERSCLIPPSSVDASVGLASISSQQSRWTRKSALASTKKKTSTANRTVKPAPRIRQASPVTKTTTTAVTSGGTPRTPLRTTSQELLSAALAASHGTTTTNGSANGISS